jgi:hypothetical protein
MPTLQKSIASAAYALFALQQPIPLDALADGTASGRFPLAQTSSPQWFAAAASEESSLLDTAPELLAMPEDAEAAGVADVSGIDLIHVYAPELLEVEQIEEPPPPPATRPDVPAEKPSTSTQIGLLKELSNLDT